MKDQATWTPSGPPRVPARPVSGCRVRMHHDPRGGRALVVVLSGRQDPDFWQEVRDVIREEVPRRSPHDLVFDLRDLDCMVGSALLGGLVAGAIEMKRLGRPGGTRIVATGDMGATIERSLALCKLEPVLGVVHDNLASALAEGRTVDDVG